MTDTRKNWQTILYRVFEGNSDGDAFHGPAILTILEDITPDQVDIQAIPGTHTIREILNHIIIWREYIVRRMSGDDSVTGKDIEDWSKNLDKSNAGWNELLLRLEQSQQFLVDQINQLGESEFQKQADRFHFLIHHDLAHLAQIAMLKHAKAS